MFGWGPEELIGQPGDVMYPSRESYEALGRIAVPTLLSGQQMDLEWEMRRKDHSTFLCRVIAKALDPQDAQQGTVWICEDITVKRGHADEVARLLGEQEAILGTASVGIVFVKDRRIAHCNRRYEEMYGYGPGELDGRPTSLLYANLEDHAKTAEVYEDFLRAKPARRAELRRRKDGSTFWARLNGRAVDPADASKGAVWTVEDITEQRDAEEKLHRVLGEQELILDNASVGIAFVRARAIQRCNRFIEDMVGAAPGELAGQSTMILFASKEDWESSGRLAYANTQPGGTHDAECRFKRKDGSLFLCRTRGRRIDAGDEDQEWIWSFEDVTAAREAQARVQRALVEQELILDNATVGIAFVRNRTYQRCNVRFAQMFGYAFSELVGSNTNLIFPTRRNFDQAGEWYAQLATGQAFSTEHRFKRKDGQVFWCKVVAKAIDPERPDEGSIWLYDDISAERAARDALEQAVAERTAELKAANERLEAEIGERKQAEERAQHLADHDALTGLPNRRLLEDRLTQALALSYRNRQQTAVMFIDLDRFKTINDSLGHSVGDLLLKEVARRLVKQLRDGDTICRIGGDEFVVVLPEVKRSSDVAHVAQKVIEQLSLPVVVEERELTVTPSIGIAVFPEDGRDAETLIRNADAAMYHAKEMGRANYQFFTEQMNLSASRRLSLENDLRRALAKGELCVYYQPIVDAKSGKVASHEALVRWQHPVRGLVSPAEFIQVAEDTGLILKIGEWMLVEACRWATFIGIERGLPVAVNLSARQFGDPKLVQMVARALKDTGLPPHLLELEITETTAMQHTDVTLGTLKKLKELGVSMAMDDFGTGYSSFSYLKRFPVDTLKIDRSFVCELDRDGDHRAIVAAIIALAHVLGLKVVAEGVETEQQKQFLRGFGCDRIQGYLTGRPQDADTAAKEYL
jgi:diguanylate cyclase (GGDEF)-like protein/PAS domain S-box-containing protein